MQLAVDIRPGESVEATFELLEAHHPATARHSRNVAALACHVGECAGVAPHLLADLEHAALLHDIGKTEVPEELLDKTGAITSDEWALLKRHSVDGASIVSRVPDLAHLARFVGGVHERWDGTGYPAGLAGLEIPLEARLIAVTDAYDTLITGRPYRPALTPLAALYEIARCAGTQFCPHGVEALVEAANPRPAAQRHMSVA